MASLIRQTVSEPKKPFWNNILVILAIVLGVNLSVELTNFLPRGIASIVSIAILIFAAVFCSFLINRKLAQYTYILIDDELFFHKQIGKREYKVIETKVYDLDWVKPLRDIEEKTNEKTNDKINVKKVYSLSCRLKGEDIYVGQFQRDKKTYRFIFQPNEALYNAIDQQLKAKTEKVNSPSSPSH